MNKTYIWIQPTSFNHWDSRAHISGYLVGYNKRLMYSVLSLLRYWFIAGGGMIRDGLVGRIPASVFETDALIVVFATLAIAWLIRVQRYRSTYLAAALLLPMPSVWQLSALPAHKSVWPCSSIYLALFLWLLWLPLAAVLRAIFGQWCADDFAHRLYGSVAILIGGLIYLFGHLGWLIFLR